MMWKKCKQFIFEADIKLAVDKMHINELQLSRLF